MKTFILSFLFLTISINVIIDFNCLFTKQRHYKRLASLEYNTMTKTTHVHDEHKLYLMESKIFNAIRHCQFKQLALYLRHNYNLHVISKDGRNVLFYALEIEDAHKRCRMIRFCLDQGVNPLQKENIHGFTPLNEAIARQQLDSVQLLLAEVSADIDWRSLDKQGRTILHQTVEANNVPILEALILILNRYSISVDVFDRNGLTPYLLATKLHLREMGQILLKKGHASGHQCDLQTHRSAYEWKSIGVKENHLVKRYKLRQDIDEAKKEGRINKVNKLKEMYYSPLSLSSENENMRRNSYLSTTTRSGLHTKSSLSINEMMDRVSEGDRPELFVNSRTDQQTFYLKHNQPTSLPPITTLRRHRPSSSFNSLIDLFQIAQIST
jgi:ankyrin repeat protein